MITIKLQDRLFAHEPSFCHSNNQRNIKKTLMFSFTMKQKIMISFILSR